MKAKKLPKQIFVAWEDLPHDEPFLSAHEKVYEHAEMSRVRRVGTYRLVEEMDVHGIASLRNYKRVKQ